MDIDPEKVAADEHAAAALAQLGSADAEPKQDSVPAAEKPARRRSRSGTSGAERARRAKQGAGKDGAPASTSTRASSSRRAKKVDIGAGMAQLYTMAGVGVSMVPSKSAAPLAIGQAMASQAEACGAAWAQLAEENPRVRAALEQLLTVSSVGVLIAAHTPIVLAGVMASGKVPANVAAMMGGAPDPGVPAAA